MWGRRVIGISGSLIWSKTLMELIFNPCGKFRWSPEGPINQIHSPHLHVWCPWDLLRSFEMQNRERDAESNGTIPSKTAILIPEFAAEDLPLGRTATMVPAFAVKDLPLGRTLMILYVRSKTVAIHKRKIMIFECLWVSILLTNSSWNVTRKLITLTYSPPDAWYGWLIIHPCRLNVYLSVIIL